MARFRVGCVAVGLCLALSALGCSDDSSGDGAAAGDGAGQGGEGSPMCGDQANCVDTVELADGLAGESASGVFMAEIVTQDGLDLDENQWMVRVSDADGAGVEGATVEVQTLSVDCGHEGPCPPAGAEEHMPGMYMITPVFAHGGPWDVNVMVHKDGEMDTVTWHFCVDAIAHGEGELPAITCPDGSEASTGHSGHMGGDAGS